MGAGSWMAGLVIAAAIGTDQGPLTDPTRPVDYLPPSALMQKLPVDLMDWRVTGVRISKDDRSAVLNGKIVRAGDTVDRARIVEIGPARVIVEIDRKRVELHLHGRDVKIQTARKAELPEQK